MNCIYVADCYATSTGMDYLGSEDRTEGGRLCKRWDSQSFGHVTDANFVEGNMTAAENFCRNPAGLGERPWCYTSNTEDTWEYCNVSHCSEGNSRD